MGFPSVIYGRPGDEKTTSSTQFAPLGAKMILPDGREFVASKAVAALNVGTPVVGKAPALPAGSSIGRTAAVAAVGATTIVLTMPATTLCTAVNQYAGGYLFSDNIAGSAYMYKIKSSNTAAAASTCNFYLEPSDPLKVTLTGGTATVTIRENQYYNVLERAAGTGSVGAPAGVAPVAVSAGYYCWLQKRGEAPLLSGGTAVVAGRPFACCTVEASFQAWHATPAAGTTEGGTTLSPVAEPWGYTMVAPAGSTSYFIGFLQL
jgi:hypothetical protein